MPSPESATVMTTVWSDRVGAKLNRAALRRVANRIGRHVLDCLLDAERIDQQRLGAIGDGRDEPDIARAALVLVMSLDLFEEIPGFDGLNIELPPARFEARHLQEIADQPLQPFRLAHRDCHLMPPLPIVETDLGHGQRLEMSQNRGERRHQLVRHVGHQLPARAIGCIERDGAPLELVGHRIERSGQLRHFIAAGFSGSHREVADAQPSRGVAQFLDARTHRADDQDRSDQGAGDEQDDADSGDRRDRTARAASMARSREPLPRRRPR